MDLVPILSALRRNKTGALLVIVQIALTLAILSNVVRIIADRATLMARPTGVIESDVFAIGFRFTKSVDPVPMRQRDLASVRAVANVVDVVVTNTYPFRVGGWTDGVSHAPGILKSGEESAHAGIYAMDQHGIGTLGLQLTEGRNFRPEEVIAGRFNGPPIPDVAIISRSLKQQLFPDGMALGKVVYVGSDPRKPVTIIGVVDRLQTAAAAGTIDEHLSDNSLILPLTMAIGNVLLMVRVKPGTIDVTMQRVRDALIKVEPDRIFGRLRPFTEIRSTAYQKDKFIAIALAILCVILVVITALGIVGLTSLWVVRRKTQIGIRRAMGATRGAVVAYFLTENALLCFCGVAVGAAAAEGLNLLLRTRYGVEPIPASDLILCSLAVMVLGQIAAARPAFVAAQVPPIEALRSI